MRRIKFITTVLEFILIIAISIILANNNYSNYWVILPAGAIIIIKYTEFKYDEKSMYSNIKAQLLLLITLLNEEGLIVYTSLKCTYHVPSFFRNKFFQTFDYLPNGAGGGRTISMEKGIVGKTFKTKESLVENFQSDEEHNDKMLNLYNFRKEEIQKINNKTNSYFTYPILDDNFKVLGVIYLESNRVNTFTSDKSTSLMKKIHTACELIDKNTF